MLEQFTESARNAIKLAEEESRAFRHDFVGTEHLLLGLMRESSGIVANVLKSFGVDADRVRQEIQQLVTVGLDTITAEKLSFTPRANQAIKIAIHETGMLLQNHVGPEHLLLGLLLERDGVAAMVLRNLGLNPGLVAREALKVRLTQFKIVERAIRPVRASVAWKRKMREELLAHLTSIYEQELENLNDPTVALQQAAERFGNPAALARELEKSVPLKERWNHDLEHRFGWRAPESAARFLARLALQISGMIAIGTGIIIGAAVAVLGWTREVWIAFRPAIALLVLFPVALFVLGMIYFKMRDSLFGAFGSRKSLSRAVLLGTGFALAVFLLGLGFIAFSEGNLGGVTPWVSTYLIAGVMMAIACGLYARLHGPAEIRDTVWVCMDLNE